jgi:hypothetical protein
LLPAEPNSTPDQLFLELSVSFAGGAEVVATPAAKAEFISSFQSSNDAYFELAPGSTQVLSVTYTPARRSRSRSLLQAGSLSVDYQVMVDASTDPAVLSDIAVQSVGTPADVFADLTSAYSLPVPTVALVDDNLPTALPPLLQRPPLAPSPRPPQPVTAVPTPAPKTPAPTSAPRDPPTAAPTAEPTTKATAAPTPAPVTPARCAVR